jgi:hypothetical protein
MKRAIDAVKQAFSALFSRIRRTLGAFLQFWQRDQLEELSEQTHRLGSASVESVTYVGKELRAMDERLSRIEGELEALRRLLEKRDSAEPAERPDTVASGPTSG